MVRDRDQLIEVFAPFAEVQRREEITRLRRRLIVLEEDCGDAWTMLRTLTLSWGRAAPGATHETTIGFDTMSAVAAEIFDLAPSTINYVSMRAVYATHQAEEFLMTATGRWGALERWVSPAQLVEAWEAATQGRAKR